MFTTLRHTFRRLARDRGFTATVLLTLALCIGANVAIFAVVDAILVRPLPFANSHRIVNVFNSYPLAGIERMGASIPNYYERRENIAAFESISICQSGSATIGESGSPRQVESGRISFEFFDTLGVSLIKGRAFTEEEMSNFNTRSIIVSYDFWQSQFEGTDDILGRELLVGDVARTVVGVLPSGFRYLDNDFKFFVPFVSTIQERQPRGRHRGSAGEMIARLSPGVTLEEAQAQIDAFNFAQSKDNPSPFAKVVQDAGFHTVVANLHADAVHQVKPILLLLQAGVLALLLIGGVNLVNILLIRAQGRIKEFAIRQALGASSRQLSREIVLETTLLAFLGGLLGLIVGSFGIQILERLGADQLPLGANIVFDARVALVSLAASLAVGLALSLPVIWICGRSNPSVGLRAETRGGTLSRSAQKLRHAFIVAQVALAFTLLSSAGLLGYSLQKILAISPGFEAAEALTAHISLDGNAYPGSVDRQLFFTRLKDELQTLPGVSEVGITSGLPFSGNNSHKVASVEGIKPAEGESFRTHYHPFVIGDYWQALGIPLIEGRFLEDADNHRDQRVCIVDQAFVETYWPGQSGLGQRLDLDVNFSEETSITIVGVVGTVKQHDLAASAPLGTIYLPHKLRSALRFSIVMRTTMKPEAMGHALQKQVHTLDPRIPVSDIKVMQTRIDDSLIARRSPAVLAGIFATVALLLSAFGTYGMLAYAVNQRQREIGVRMALGAKPQQIMKQFLSLGSRLLAIGIALGAFGAWAAGRAMQNVLYEVASFNITIIATTALIMIAVVLLATLLPSRRAAKIDPMEALRGE